MRTKLIVGGIIVLAALAFLVYSGAQSGGLVYYIGVDTYMSDARYHSQRVRLAGRAADEGVQRDPVALIAKFDLLEQKSRLPVVYHGVVPDLFKPGCDLVVEGKMDDQGVFQADVMLTKCASKYQAEDHSMRLEPKS